MKAYRKLLFSILFQLRENALSMYYIIGLLLFELKYKQAFLRATLLWLCKSQSQ